MLAKLEKIYFTLFAVVLANCQQWFKGDTRTSPYGQATAFFTSAETLTIFLFYKYLVCHNPACYAGCVPDVRLTITGLLWFGLWLLNTELLPSERKATVPAGVDARRWSRWLHRYLLLALVVALL